MSHIMAFPSMYCIEKMLGQMSRVYLLSTSQPRSAVRVTMHCPICGLYYAGEFTGTIDIALAVCLIKTFCLIEAVNGRLLGTE